MIGHYERLEAVRKRLVRTDDLDSYTERIQGNMEVIVPGGKFDPKLREQMKVYVRQRRQEDPLLKPRTAKVELSREYGAEMSMNAFRRTYWDPAKTHVPKELTSEEEEKVIQLPPPKKVTLKNANYSRLTAPKIYYEGDPVGYYAAEPVGDGFWDVEIRMCVPRSMAIQLAGQAWALLFSED